MFDDNFKNDDEILIFLVKFGEIMEKLFFLLYIFYCFDNLWDMIILVMLNGDNYNMWVNEIFNVL